MRRIGGWQEEGKKRGWRGEGGGRQEGVGGGLERGWRGMVEDAGRQAVKNIVFFLSPIDFFLYFCN